MDNRKSLKVFLNPSCNVQSLGFPREISSGDITVNSWEENEVRMRNQCTLLSQENRGQKGEGRVISQDTVISQDETYFKKKMTKGFELVG